MQKTSPEDSNIIERFSLYKVALSEIKSRPVFGFGPGQGIKQLEFFQTLPENMKSVSRHPALHSFYLNFAADFGFSGFLIFLAILYFLFSGLNKSFYCKDEFLASLGSGLIWGLIGDIDRRDVRYTASRARCCDGSFLACRAHFQADKGKRMRISGATIIRNGVKFGFPFVESIKSVLPLCFEFIVAVGKSEDATKPKIEGINDPRIKIIDTVWDDAKRAGGQVLSEQTNIALKNCKGDWIFYIQSDEAVNENDFEKIKNAVSKADKSDEIDGIIFDYLHFYGSYSTVQTGRNWYCAGSQDHKK